MDTQAFIYVLAFPQINALYLQAFHSATLLFLMLYLLFLVNRAQQRGIEASASQLPPWLNFMYPAWLDCLTLKDILYSFALALGAAIVIWPLLAMALLALMMHTSKP
jgi:hypothetical protein